MNPNQNEDFNIDPAIILLGLGYATSLLVAIGWVVSCIA